MVSHIRPIFGEYYGDPMCMEISGAGRHSRPGDDDFDQIYSSRELSKFAGQYDYVVLAAPLTTAPRGCAEVLAAMKSSARLINAGRGELVDTEALIGALTSGSAS